MKLEYSPKNIGLTALVEPGDSGGSVGNGCLHCAGANQKHEAVFLLRSGAEGNDQSHSPKPPGCKKIPLHFDTNQSGLCGLHSGSFKLVFHLNRFFIERGLLFYLQDLDEQGIKLRHN